MLRSILTMTVRDGCEQDFERVWADWAEQISLLPGQRGQSLARDLHQPGKYIVAAEWATADDLNAFQSSPIRASLSAALEPLRESASKSVAEVLLSVEGREVARS